MLRNYLKQQKHVTNANCIGDGLAKYLVLVYNMLLYGTPVSAAPCSYTVPHGFYILRIIAYWWPVGLCDL